MGTMYCGFTPKGKIVPCTNEMTVRYCWNAIYREVALVNWIASRDTISDLKKRGYSVRRVVLREVDG